MKTRYFSKKNEDGCFFAKCGKDDQSESIQDGRAYRHWTFGDKEGQTLGWEYKTLSGLVESSFIKEASQYSEEQWCIGLQNTEGGFVDVLQLDMCKKDGSFSQDVLTLAKKLPNIDLDSEFTFGCWHNNEGAWKTPQGKTVIPCYLTLQQNGQNVKSAYEFKDGAYVGLPDPEVKTVRGKEVKDFSERDNFLFEKISEFNKAVSALGRKDNRPKTEAEVAATVPPSSEDDDSDVPF